MSIFFFLQGNAFQGSPSILSQVLSRITFALGKQDPALLKIFYFLKVYSGKGNLMALGFEPG